MNGIPTPDLTVVIVNYNVRGFLEQALHAVRNAARGLQAEVFVVDNCSVDDSVAMVREKFPEVQLIANVENVGFARANNQALRQSKGRYVLLLNPDTVVQEDTFQKCLRFMDTHPEAGALGARMIDGAGKFLPESRRGFPAPFVAFCKAVGLHAIFPRSRTFNTYYLGYLDDKTTHPADILCGAFMWVRREALEKAGLLDEAFFMYGEDIDLSWRIVQAGYVNYYFPETTIIHYKGESTKKGSLNYVRVFYQAMIIFARKHFEGARGRRFVAMLQAAVYTRAALTLAYHGFARLAWPLADGAVFMAGMAMLKHFWAIYRFGDPNYYTAEFLSFNAPLYTLLWILGIYFSGGYDQKTTLYRSVRGVFWGSFLIAAIYGFLNAEYRTSRALILLGAAWAFFAVLSGRALQHLILYRNLRFGEARVKNVLIIGLGEEIQRVKALLQQTAVRWNYLGAVSPVPQNKDHFFLCSLEQLEEAVRIYRADELVFCGKDVPARVMMHWMARLGPDVAYKVVPEEGMSVIGSSSRNSSGELYTIDICYRIAEPAQRRNKRLFDLAFALALLPTLPVQPLVQRTFWPFIAQWARVILGKTSWVGYSTPGGSLSGLPELRPAPLSPASGLPLGLRNTANIDRLNFLYAKDYSLETDLRIVLQHFRVLGGNQATT
jgi:GT2 family glycosyltransferase